MIITVHGTERANYSAGAALVTYASFNMLQTTTRNLILPLIDYDAIRDIENLAYGKTDIHDIMQGEGVYSDSGIDALITRADTGNINAETFGTYITHAYGKKHRLDIAGMTKQMDFEADLEQKLTSVSELLKRASKVYDNVFVLTNGKNTKLSAQLDAMAEKTIIMIRQGDAETGLDLKKVKAGDAIIVSMDYEAESRWTAEAMQRDYGVKKIYTMPHNAKFRDAIIAGRIIEFSENNATNDKQDDNYQFTKAINDVLAALFGKKSEDDEDVELPKNPDFEDEPAMERTEVDSDKVKLEEVEYKKGLFGRKRYKRVAMSADAYKNPEKKSEIISSIDKNGDFSDIPDEEEEASEEVTETAESETKEKPKKLTFAEKRKLKAEEKARKKEELKEKKRQQLKENKMTSEELIKKELELDEEDEPVRADIPEEVKEETPSVQEDIPEIDDIPEIEDIDDTEEPEKVEEVKVTEEVKEVKEEPKRPLTAAEKMRRMKEKSKA